MKTVKRELTGAYLPETMEELHHALVFLGYRGESILAFVYWNDGQDDPRGYAAEISIAGQKTPIFMFGFEDVEELSMIVKTIIPERLVFQV